MPSDFVGTGAAGFYIDPLYFVFVLPAMLLAFYAQSRVRSAYSRWSRVRNNRGVTGVQVAQVLLPRENMTNVRLEGTPGELSDHYDPGKNTLRFSPAVASQPTIAAMSIAAHEIGHAAQDRDGYLWLRVRGGIVPFVQIGSQLGYLVFFLGLMGQLTGLAWLGILLIASGTIFALVTLPVELDASNRAMRMLEQHNLITSAEEKRAARDMLDAAALTYFAAAAQALSVLLYYVMLLMRSSASSSDRR
ncbi:MAG: zinc metallopeptidase [Anaerolineae bacterium]